MTTRVRWRLSLSDPPPMTGDLLITAVADGVIAQAGDGWTVVAPGNAAWRYARADDFAVRDVLIVSPPGIPDDQSTRAPVDEATAATPAEAITMITTPGGPTVIRLPRVPSAVFVCPVCGGRGVYVGDRKGIPQVRLNRPTNEQVMAASGNVVALSCLASAPHMVKWRLLLTDR